MSRRNANRMYFAGLGAMLIGLGLLLTDGGPIALVFVIPGTYAAGLGLAMFMTRETDER